MMNRAGFSLAALLLERYGMMPIVGFPQFDWAIRQDSRGRREISS